MVDRACERATPVIDSHLHLWRRGRNGFEWPTPDLEPIYRDFELADLERLCVKHDVEGAILVQSQPHDLDTDWLCSLHGQSRFVAGVVGWVAMAAADAPARISELAGRPGFVGIRPMLQAIPANDWILRPQAAAALEAIIDRGLCFDALIQPRQLTAMGELSRRYPELKVIIDHGAKPDLTSAGDAAFAAWARGIDALAGQDNVVCKLSGLLTEMESGGPDTPEGLRRLSRAATHLADAFGAHRLMWGSDWPVVTLRAGFARWRTWLGEFCAGWGDDQRAALWGGTARRIYGLEECAA